jgi:flagellum-specific peptidoglycan hydrolase FlgJ
MVPARLYSSEQKGKHAMLTEQQLEFREKIIGLSKTIAPRYGLDWRLMAATAILESGWGESTLAHEANNIFGIRATGKTRPEDRYSLKGNADGEAFRRFDSHRQACHGFGRLVGRSSLYSRARQMARQMALKFMVANMSPVYCPDDPDYREKMMQIIEMLDVREKLRKTA